MAKRPLALSAMITLLLVGISGARAEPKMKYYTCPAMPEDEGARVTLAEDLFDKGITLSEEGRFELALTYFLCSASLVEHINTTFNIAQAGRFMRNKTRLRVVFKRFVDKHAGTATAEALEKLIAVIDAEN